MSPERTNEQRNIKDHRPSVWQRIGRPAPQNNVPLRAEKALSANDEDATSHIGPLYICAVMDGVPLKRVLVDNGAAINILPSKALSKLEIIAVDTSPFAAQANAVEAYYYDREVGPYQLIGMNKYGRLKQTTIHRDMNLPEWKLLRQEVNRPYNYNVLRPLPGTLAIEEVSNEDN
ncbi:OLC1v1031371C1 [Oldenlandia corymbosa var. corymbosa]|uniref:OLC1v1031371C1 n=1 Tax=Oldenlandia corymbosa var. corymbosa TaxID=529605 RepID=A0AAV1CJY5_OLDCO|nr:OLC1v1031371C1 [Oldenlandia corymbosa var. corymbosa]